MLPRSPPHAPFGEEVLEDGAADTGAAVLRQQRDVDDADLPLPAGEIEASDGPAVPEDDQKIAAPVGPLVNLVLRVELGAACLPARPASLSLLNPPPILNRGIAFSTV